jgi:DNA-binding transcriptional regulator YiaG
MSFGGKKGCDVMCSLKDSMSLGLTDALRKRLSDLPMRMLRMDAKRVRLVVEMAVDRVERQLTAMEASSNQHLGAVMKKARELAGLSQKDVAAILGHATTAHVSNWESGAETPAFSRYWSIPDIQMYLGPLMAEACGVKTERTA